MITIAENYFFGQFWMTMRASMITKTMVTENDIYICQRNESQVFEMAAIGK